ncbi:DUF262 domain-containing protein [Pseudoalteromonas rubra]|uniref:GmrSD restriction endonucleases N-terminal domain-containing protein n=1 Tax=Pseudoalteromonas rubra TaxID=43658 RepID=A0A5S3X6W6_9GAMM|nr:DUF262 domain-containing protein [Pseudoalteromonas rubra]TMP39871.1 hypothetical protein CWB98_00975 [Pseudoalteromonas rubra]
MSEENIEFIEDEQQKETDDDIGALDQNIFSSAVVSANDWTTETLISQINKGNIKLNPDFQRRDAWDKKRKSKFIESLILGLPIPQVVLAESKERRGSYIVLDGKQRLLSIRQFSAESNDNVYQQLKLTGLEIREDLKNKSLDSLRSDLTLFDDLTAFENQPIRTVVIKNWPNEDFLYHVFLRLNTGSVPLSPQELRQALHPGPFVTFLDKKSSESNALKEILKLKKPDFRMRDAELLLRYFSFKNFLVDYSGTLKKFLDDTCNSLNSEWEENKGIINSQLEEFELAHNTIKSIFNGNQYRKWSGRSYESRFNRAVFDIMILSFSVEEVRKLVIGKEAEIESAYKNICSNDRQFLASIESTTKSLTATQTRISTWFNILNETLQSDLPVPQLIDNRIV